MKNLMRLAGRVFNAPLAILRERGDAMLYVLGPRLNLAHLPDVSVSLIDMEENERKPYQVTSDGIAVIDVSDALVRRASGMDAWCGLTSYEQIQTEWVGALDDSNVKGVLVCFDSPGGEVGGLFDLVDRIYAKRGVKPMYASVSEMAASAAYALASVCDKIFLTQTSAVGSIGVYALHVDQSAMDAKDGLKYTYVFAGEKKVDGNPHQPMSDRVQEEFQSEIDRTYGIFTASVARNRKMDEKKVVVTEAGVYYGKAAISAGLADQVGTPEQAMGALRTAIAKSKPANAGTAARWETPESQAADIALTQDQIQLDAPEVGALNQSPDAVIASAPNSTQTKEPEMAKLKNADADSKLDPQSKKTKGDMGDETVKKTAVEDDDEDGADEDEPKASAADDEEDEEDEEPEPKKKPAGKKSSAAVAYTRGQIAAINDLCLLAGHPDKAGSFLAAGLTVRDVRAKLVDLRAEASQQHPIFSGVNPMKGGKEMKEIRSQAASYAREKGITKEQAFAQMLEANPEIWDQHRKERRAAAFNFSLGNTSVALA